MGGEVDDCEDIGSQEAREEAEDFQLMVVMVAGPAIGGVVT